MTIGYPNKIEARKFRASLNYRPEYHPKWGKRLDPLGDQSADEMFKSDCLFHPRDELSSARPGRRRTVTDGEPNAEYNSKQPSDRCDEANARLAYEAASSLSGEVASKRLDRRCRSRVNARDRVVASEIWRERLDFV